MDGCEVPSQYHSDIQSTTNHWGLWTSLMYLLSDYIHVCVNLMSFQIID